MQCQVLSLSAPHRRARLLDLTVCCLVDGHNLRSQNLTRHNGLASVWLTMIVWLVTASKSSSHRFFRRKCGGRFPRHTAKIATTRPKNWRDNNHRRPYVPAKIPSLPPPPLCARENPLPTTAPPLHGGSPSVPPCSLSSPPPAFPQIPTTVTPLCP